MNEAERIKQSMTLRQLEIWTIIARRLSITKAAKELRITQPSVTQQIELLEKEYRLKLYEINFGRGIELTPAGRLFRKANTQARVKTHQT